MSVKLALRISSDVNGCFLFREAHLRELRDKLQAQNSKAKQVKLKKMINGPPVPVPLGPTKQLYLGNVDSLFD